jgi:hypothetical protein
MPELSLSATQIVPIKAAQFFAVLSDPGRHSAIDRSGMIRRAASAEPIAKVGDVFRMVVSIRWGGRSSGLLTQPHSVPDG